MVSINGVENNAIAATSTKNLSSVEGNEEKLIFLSEEENETSFNASDLFTIEQPKQRDKELDKRIDIPTEKLAPIDQRKEVDVIYTDENGNKNFVYYNEDGSFQVEKYEYKLFHRNITIEQYDKEGNIMHKQEGDTITLYNEDGSIAKTTEYNKRGKAAVVTLYNEDGSINTKTQYNKRGNIDSTKYNEDGSFTKTQYDTRGRGKEDNNATKIVSQYDKDGNLILQQEFRGICVAEEEQKKIEEAEKEILEKKKLEDKTNEIDTDGDGIITQEELQAYYEEKEKELQARNDMQEKDLYDKLDADGDGIITEEEIQSYYDDQIVGEAQE